MVNNAQETSLPVVSYPMVVVGFETSELEGEALSIERDEKFKCLLIEEVEKVVGPVDQNFAGNSTVILNTKSQSGGTLDPEEVLDEFLQANGKQGNVAVGTSKSVCRNTRTGWVREWPFTVLLQPSGAIWACGDVIDAFYQKYRSGRPVPDPIKHAFQQLIIKLIVVDQFEISCVDA